MAFTCIHVDVLIPKEGQELLIFLLLLFHVFIIVVIVTFLKKAPCIPIIISC